MTAVEETTTFHDPCYVYGIVRADVELPAGVTGLDDRSVGLVTHRPLAAVVSDLQAGDGFAQPANLLAHARVLDAIALRDAVIPLRFGTVVPARADVVDEVLRPATTELEDLLDGLQGRFQFTVHAQYDEQRILTEIVAENAEIAELSSLTREQPEDAGYFARIRLGELVAAELDAKRQVDGPRLLAGLVPHAVTYSIRELTVSDQLVDAAFLVEHAQRESFEQAAEEAAAQFAGRCRVKLVGPSAPYDFVDVGGVAWV